jgi:translation initiation factor eIF-2B subunit delta
MATNANEVSQEAPITASVAQVTSNGGNEGKASKGENTAQPKLTNAELKAKAKAEKAARRAQSKDAKGAGAPGATNQGTAASLARPVGADATGKVAKGGKGRPDQPQRKQEQQQKSKDQSAGSENRPSQGRRPSGLGRRPSIAAREKDPRNEIPEIFSHIPMAKRISTIQAHRDVHPVVLALGQRMAAFTLTDSISRLEMTLLALRKVTAAC